MSKENKEEIIKLETQFEALEKQKGLVRKGFVQSNDDLGFIGKIKLSNKIVDAQGDYIDKMKSIMLEQLDISHRLSKLIYRGEANALLANRGIMLDAGVKKKFDEEQAQQMKNTADAINDFGVFIEDQIKDIESQDLYKRFPNFLDDAVERLSKDFNKFVLDRETTKNEAIERWRIMLGHDFLA